MEPTCADRIRKHYEGRMEDIATNLKINQESTDDHERDEAYDALMEMPLCVELVRVVKITLGTGGPGDWFEATVDEDGDIGRIEYHFNDWFDHAAINVTDDDNARVFCEQFVESALMVTA